MSEDRALPHAWILPGEFHGAAPRVYDRDLDARHILWSDPLRQYDTRRLGPARGAGIIQHDTSDAGEALRRSFTEPTTDSFRRRGEHPRDGSATRPFQADFRARRMRH
ncbi:MAG: hypothetical protein ACREFY_05315 [Acetobacteraceae bacterium]